MEENLLKEIDFDRCVLHCCFSSDDKYILSSGHTGKVKLYDTETGKLIREMIHGECSTYCCFSSDDKNILSCGEDGIVKLFNIEGDLIKKMKHGNIVRC